MADATTATTTTAAETTLVENRDVVCLYGVTNAAYRGNYAILLPDPRGDAERLPVRILGINVSGRRVQHPGASIRVRRTAIVDVPPMRYYTLNHPVMAAWAAENFTTVVIQARIAEALMREGWPDAQAHMMIPVPGNSQASRMYQDLQPWDSNCHVNVYTVNPTDYAQRGGATPGATLLNIAEGRLPHPHVEMVIVPMEAQANL